MGKLRETKNSLATFVWPGPIQLCLVMLTLVCLLYPMLSKAPQNPDGAEMIMAAQHGGVLHPPGYPIQMWLNRLFIHLPFEFPATRLALFSLLSGIATFILILKILGSSKKSWPEALLGASWFLFFPTAWYLTVQPEKYIFACCFFALLIVQMIFFSQKKSDSFTLRDSLLLGTLCACALLQHTTTLLMSPFALVSFYFLIHEKNGRWKKALATMFAFALCFVGMYLSLFFLSAPGLWPDWGKIRTLGDLIDVIILKDFASFQPAVQQLFSKTDAATGALALFCEDYWKAFNIVGILPILGLPFLWLKTNKPIFWAFCSALLMNIVFLALAKFPGPGGLVAETYLERYSIPLVLILAILSGYGAMWVRDLVPMKFHRLVGVLFLLVPLSLFYFGKEKADASKEMTLDLFREGLSLTQDPKAVYFAGTDLELFYGFETPSGIRFPVFGDYTWASRIAPEFEPRLKPEDFDGVKVTVQLAMKVYDRGLTIMVSQPTILNGAPSRAIQKGLFWFLDSSAHPEFAKEIPSAASKLCNVIEKFDRPRPIEGFRYPRYIFSFFPTAYQNAGEFLQQLGDKDGAMIASRIAASLRDGKNPKAWQDACREFRVRYPQ